MTKAEKRLGKKASEKFIDVKTSQKTSSPKKKKTGTAKPNTKVDTKSANKDDRSGGKSKNTSKTSPRKGKKAVAVERQRRDKRLPAGSNVNREAAKANDNNSNKDSGKISAEAEALDDVEASNVMAMVDEEQDRRINEHIQHLNQQQKRGERALIWQSKWLMRSKSAER